MNATPTGRRMKGDEGLHIRFFVQAVESELKSKLEGRPIYDDTEFIEIRIPGDDKTIINNLATDEYRQRFPDEYAAFKSGIKETTSGTPLEHWAAVSKSQVAQLKHVGISSVEQLANVSDDNAQKFMGGYVLRDNARTFLKTVEDTALVQKQEAAIAELKAEIEELKAKKVK